MSGLALKKIAVITMLIDHIGAAVLWVCTSAYDGSAVFAGADILNQIFRIIGRTSFPLFCFLLVEGFCHTRSVQKYLLRLFLFALLSEIPFDLAFYDRVWDPAMQNVFFTLFFGVGAMAALRLAERAGGRMLKAAGVLGMVLCGVAAYLLRTDYSWKGVLLILVLYVLRNQRKWSCLAGYGVMCVFMLNTWSFPAFYLISGYNGEKGRGLKYFFYVFYPVHLLVLAGIRIIMLKYV